MAGEQIAHWVRNMAAAVGFFFTGIFMAYASWDMVSTLLNLYDNLFLKGIMWTGYITILILWIVIIPAWKAVAAQEPSGS